MTNIQINNNFKRYSLNTKHFTVKCKNIKRELLANKLTTIIL